MVRRIRMCTLLLLLPVLLLLLSGAGIPNEVALKVIAPENLPTAGEEFILAVEIGDNPGLCAVQFTMTFDPEALRCTDAKAGKVIEGMLWITNPDAPSGAMLAAAATDPAEGDGTLAEFTFMALTDLADWPVALTEITLTDAESREIPYELTIQTAANSEENPEAEPEEEGSPENELPAEVTEEENAGSEQISENGEADGDAVEGASEETMGSDAGADSEHTFTDIGGHWSEAYVKTAAGMGLFNGYPDGSFRPDVSITRGDFVLTLWRLAGRPEPTGESPFTDVTPDGYYSQAILWAYEQGYVKGVSETAFAPDELLTREQAMTILFRFDGGMSGMEMFFMSSYDSAYRDSGEISDWAKNAMYWGVFQTLIEGTGPDTLSPKMHATRAQLAKILVNYISAI